MLNEHASAADGALLYQNPVLAARAIEIEHEDVAAGNRLRNRYSRVRESLMAETGCSKAHAERAIREGKLMRLERFLDRLPTVGAELSLQLHRIADAQEESHPVAAVAAIREIARINGLYAPKKIEITGGATEREVAIDAILEVLDDRDREDLRRILMNIEAAKASGRLRQLEAVGASEQTDAEIVEPDPGEGAAN